MLLLTLLWLQLMSLVTSTLCAVTDSALVTVDISCYQYTCAVTDSALVTVDISCYQYTCAVTDSDCFGYS